MPVEWLAPLPDGMFYRHDLVGCRVETRTGEPVGMVQRRRGDDGGSRLVVDADSGEVLVPLAADICTSIDVAGRQIVIEPPEGLLEVNARTRRPDQVDRIGQVEERLMTFDIVTIFPAMIEQALAAGIVGRAIERGTLEVTVHDLRDFTTDRHRVVDDVPYGGGPGMVLKPEPLFRALDAIEARARPGRRRGDADVAAGPGSRRTSRSAEPATRTWCCCAGATKASTSGCGRGSTRRFRSATTC